MEYSSVRAWAWPKGNFLDVRIDVGSHPAQRHHPSSWSVHRLLSGLSARANHCSCVESRFLNGWAPMGLDDFSLRLQHGPGLLKLLAEWNLQFNCSRTHREPPALLAVLCHLKEGGLLWQRQGRCWMIQESPHKEGKSSSY